MKYTYSQLKDLRDKAIKNGYTQARREKEGKKVRIKSAVWKNHAKEYLAQINRIITLDEYIEALEIISKYKNQKST